MMLGKRKQLILTIIISVVITLFIASQIIEGRIFFGPLFQIFNFLFFYSAPQGEDFAMNLTAVYVGIFIFNFLLFYLCSFIQKLLKRWPLIISSITLGVVAAFSYTLLVGDRGSLIPGFSSSGWPFGFLPADIIFWFLLILIVNHLLIYMNRHNIPQAKSI